MKDATELLSELSASDSVSHSASDSTRFAHRLWLWVSLLYAAIFLFVLRFPPHGEDGERVANAFFNLYPTLAYLFGGASCLLAARREEFTSARRAGWYLLGLSCFTYIIGDAIYAYYETYLRVEVPFPGADSVAYLLTYPFLLSGVLLLGDIGRMAGRMRLLLDSAIAAGSVGVLAWHFLMQPLWNDSQQTLLGKLVGIAYPLGDVAALFGVIVLFNSVSIQPALRRCLLLVAAGIAAWSIGDILFTYDTLQGTYQTGGWYDWAWPLGGLLLGHAALLPQSAAQTAIRPSLRDDLSASNPLRLLLPYGVGLASLVIVALDSRARHGAISDGVILSGVGLVSLVIARQVLTLFDNRHLTLEVLSLNENLEHTVARRTEQLQGLHELTKAVNSTLDEERVLEDALKFAQRALHADAIALWLPVAVDDDDDAMPEHSSLDEPNQAPLEYSLARHCGLDTEPQILAELQNLTGCDCAEIAFVSQLANEVAPPKNSGAEGGKMHCLRAPLVWQQKQLGAIGVLRSKGEFGATEAGLLESIGLEVGTALENARRFGAAVEAADRDSVTGLLNHRAVQQRLERELARAARHNHPVAVVMMDLNNFKLFNDTYGHPVGDQILKRAAQMLQAQCREEDIPARYGGDEFIAILPNSDAEAAQVMAERLNRLMSQEGFRRAGDERVIPVTLSFGIASFPADSTNRHELLTIADSNLYAAKFSDNSIRSSARSGHSRGELRQDHSFEVLDAMVTAVDNKDRYTRRHSEDVTEFALWIAEEIGLSEETMRILRIGGLLHDVGKIGVPEDVLHKPGRLSPEEYEVMKRHAKLGALIVSGVPGMEAIVDIVRFHHERWDGKGYPDGLAEDNIPLLGRLLAVADAFSAMTTERPYRKSVARDAALDEIREGIGTQFDPQMARAFLTAAARRKEEELSASRGE